MSQLVFKINEDHRVRPQTRRPEQHLLMQDDVCNARAYALFLFQGTFRVLFANFEILKH
jgi:hypothetical protein